MEENVRFTVLKLSALENLPRIHKVYHFLKILNRFRIVEINIIALYA